MEKILKEIQVLDSKTIDTDYGYDDKAHDITDVLNYLSKAIDEGATHVKIEGRLCGEDIETTDIVPLKIEEESDADFEARKGSYKTRIYFERKGREGKRVGNIQ